MRLIAKVVRLSDAKFHCHRLTRLHFEILDFELIFHRLTSLCFILIYHNTVR